MNYKNRKKRLIDISIVLITLTAILCIIMAVRSYYEYKRGNDAYLTAADFFLSSVSDTEREVTQESELSTVSADDDTGETPAVTDKATGETTEIPAENPDTAFTAQTPPPVQPAGRISVDFNALKAVNGDIDAWIISEGTPISYPVVTCGSEEDYSYYISHLFNGVKNKLGTLFFDARTVPFKENNTIIYGHNMLNGTMFSSLLSYRKQNYYESHPEMRLYTPEGNYRIIIFSGYMTTDKSDAYVLNLTGDAFAEYIKKAIANSDFTSGVKPTAADRLITLSTCDNQTSEKRYVVHGILVPE